MAAGADFSAAADPLCQGDL